MRQVALELQVDGQVIPAVGDPDDGSEATGFVDSCSVRLGLDGKDEFRISILTSLANGGKVANPAAIEKAGGWIGKSAQIAMKGSSGGMQFEGTVTEVQMLVDNDGRDVVVLIGHGPLWFLSGIERFRTFTKKAFGAVAKEVLSAHQIAAKDESESTHQFEFLVQHGESDLAFLERICRQVGEWLYYDGSAVFVGVSSDHGGRPVRLEWGKHLFQLRSEARCAPLLHQVKAYRYENSTTFDKTSKQPRAAGPAWAANAVQASLQVFAEPSLAIGGSYTAAKDVDSAVAVRSECVAGGTATVWGQTSRTGLALGRCVALEEVGGLSGEYRVYELEHSFSSQAGYSCTFFGVPKHVRRPRPSVAAPDAAVLQVGTVKDNVDPEKQGRVRVQLRWHTELSPWLRVLQVHAGADHGLYTIPEKEDEVLVGFECGDPDRPLVLGSLYHGKAKPQAKAVHPENDHKQFVTRAGNLIRITDTKGQEEISVSTPDESNQIVLHAGSNPTILIKTKGSMKIEADKAIDIKAGEKMTLTAPKIELKASEKVAVGAPKIEHAAQQEFQVTAGSAAKISAATVEAAASATLKLSAGASADLSAGAAMALKAPLIRLN